jgi:hypothetical protein
MIAGVGGEDGGKFSRASYTWARPPPELRNREEHLPARCTKPVRHRADYVLRVKICLRTLAVMVSFEGKEFPHRTRRFLRAYRLMIKLQ